MSGLIGRTHTTIFEPVEAVQPPGLFPLNPTRLSVSKCSITTGRRPPLAVESTRRFETCCHPGAGGKLWKGAEDELRQPWGIKRKPAARSKTNLQSPLQECFFMHDIDTTASPHLHLAQYLLLRGSTATATDHTTYTVQYHSSPTASTRATPTCSISCIMKA